mmetsp:Transcript_23563/g.65349  ORF Transcript_23563/g.65349 Transcript_23563/m.65349 type:complete len:258 (+) Transcript_23563:269-1042(+)
MEVRWLGTLDLGAALTPRRCSWQLGGGCRGGVAAPSGLPCRPREEAPQRQLPGEGLVAGPKAGAVTATDAVTVVVSARLLCGEVLTGGDRGRGMLQNMGLHQSQQQREVGANGRLPLEVADFLLVLVQHGKGALVGPAAGPKLASQGDRSLHRCLHLLLAHLVGGDGLHQAGDSRLGPAQVPLQQPHLLSQDGVVLLLAVQLSLRRWQQLLGRFAVRRDTAQRVHQEERQPEALLIDGPLRRLYGPSLLQQARGNEV